MFENEYFNTKLLAKYGSFSGQNSKRLHVSVIQHIVSVPYPVGEEFQSSIFHYSICFFVLHLLTWSMNRVLWKRCTAVSVIIWHSNHSVYHYDLVSRISVNLWDHCVACWGSSHVYQFKLTVFFFSLVSVFLLPTWIMSALHFLSVFIDLD